jgi:proton-translocating NADH-quinone oxidoreductase chain N
MTFFIQIFGLIFNLYLVFLTLKGPNNVSHNSHNLSINNKYWLGNRHFDQNRLELLNRISILLILSYSLFEVDFYFFNITDLNLLDGLIKLTNTKSIINFNIFLIII